MRALHLFSFLLLVSVCFSSLLWDVDIRGEARTSPVVFNDRIIIASGDGNVYALNKANSQVAWKTEVGDAVDTLVYSNRLIVLTKDGKVTALDSNGAESWTFDFNSLNITTVYAAGKNSKGLYVATANGIYKVESGSASAIYMDEGTYTKPVFSDSYMIFGVDNFIVRSDLNGNVQWTKEINENLWKSSPVISGQSIYFGALDDRMHSITLSGGYDRWSVITNGWVLSTPLVDSGTVYFGSNDGYVYAVSENSGSIDWKTKIGSSVVEQPESGVIGGEPVVFVGSTDGSVYGLMIDSGERVWEASATDRVGKPLYYDKKVYFGSYDGYVYVHDTERACSIETPEEGETVGYKEVIVSGKSVSEVGSQQVFIRINNEGWTEAEVSPNGDWVYYIDPQEDLVESINSISCRVVDLGGEETGDSFTTVNFIRDSTLPLENLEVTVVPQTPLIGEEFIIYVNSRTDGSPVYRATVNVNGNDYDVDHNITMSINQEGTYEVKASKLGYNTRTAEVTVVTGELDPLWYIAGGVLLIIVLWIIYAQVVSRIFKKKE